MSRKRKYILICILVGSIIFGSSYYGYLRYTKSYKHNPEIHENSNSVMSEFKFENAVNSSTKLIFKTLYVKSGEEVVKEKIAGENYKEIIGYDKEKLESYFAKENFKVQNMNSKEITLVRKFQKYSPNKYIVGIKKVDDTEYLAIFKTDEEGNMFIENDKDITHFKIELLRKADIEMLRDGSKEFQFDNKEQAAEMITEYET